MDQESNQMEQHPVLCRNGCGFYSNNGTDGLCSVCFKDMVKKKQQPPTNMPASLAPTPGAMASLSIDESSSGSSPAKTSVDTALPTVRIPSQTEKVRNFEGFFDMLPSYFSFLAELSSIYKYYNGFLT
jgi:hypothetical protein